MQKDKVSEGKIQEHTPILKEALKGKAMDISKGSIERGVKEHKHTERDHDGSAFVYPKQKKKTIEETISHAATQISAPCFDTAEKGYTQSKISI